MEVGFQTATKKLALFAIIVAATVVTNLIVIPMPQPLAQYDLSPVLIYAVGVLITPVMAGLIIGSAQGIGTAYKAAMFGWPPVFIFGAVFVRGVEAMLISALTRLGKSSNRISTSKLDTIAMVIGVIWETAGFFMLDAVLFGIGFSITTLGTIVDAVFIPIAICLVVVVRRVFGVKRLM